MLALQQQQRVELVVVVLAVAVVSAKEQIRLMESWGIRTVVAAVVAFVVSVVADFL